MKIRTLTLKNFRSHQETVLKLDRFNFIRGPNGRGKSSVQMALEYLFTGRCELTDAAGRGAEALIRAREKELEISATLGDGDTICRRRRRWPRRAGNRGAPPFRSVDSKLLAPLQISR
ncbi:MAG TPA: AAA family ATPase [Candidatus Sulfotelmatobacter sp.]|nr:AAA family ATPase [Candidatus Sulfotelmatobacter sp.]